MPVAERYALPNLFSETVFCTVDRFLLAFSPEAFLEAGLFPTVYFALTSDFCPVFDATFCVFFEAGTGAFRAPLEPVATTAALASFLDDFVAAGFEAATYLAEAGLALACVPDADALATALEEEATFTEEAEEFCELDAA